MIRCNLFFISAPKLTATAAPAKEQFLISPITGERVPASKMADHMRYGTYVIISVVIIVITGVDRIT